MAETPMTRAHRFAPAQPVGQSPLPQVVRCLLHRSGIGAGRNDSRSREPTDGRELVLTRYTEPEPELSLLLKKLKLELPAQPPPKITATAPAPPTPL
jgi:hypothetical protein